jgi:ankyrin repeat protein
MAALGDHPETKRVLVGMGSDMLAQDADGSTPLHHAAAPGHLETVRVLVEMGDTQRCIVLLLMGKRKY